MMITLQAYSYGWNMETGPAYTPGTLLDHYDHDYKNGARKNMILSIAIQDAGSRFE